MLFNSLDFIMFFPIVALIYYLLRNHNRLNNLWLLIASYYFYMNLKPAYALILIASTLITYFCGRLLETYHEDTKLKKVALAVCVVLNFSILFIFKYYNFINGSVESLLSLAGIRWDVPYLDVLLPVGISFFTFQSAGYIIDVYRKTVPAERNFLTYALFVSFFPVILAGPIQRAKNLIPQLKAQHPILYDNVITGLRMMLWGYFMKLCVADRLGTYVDSVFDHIPQHNGVSLAIASVFYSIQIYGDFAGYSLVALGCARMMGFRLPDNFLRPYFSTTIKEFWKRWHIGLSSWFGDYLYIPLGGNRVKYWHYLLNLMIVFLVSGLWHGAAWTFVFWGALHGLYQIVEAVKRKLAGGVSTTNSMPRFISIMIVFLLVSLAWIFFRAETIQDGFTIVTKILTQPGAPFIQAMPMLLGCLSLAILFIKDFADEFHPSWKMLNADNQVVSVLTTAVLITYILLFGVLDSSQFIYFQF